MVLSILILVILILRWQLKYFERMTDYLDDRDRKIIKSLHNPDHKTKQQPQVYDSHY
jgi:hypothetical protein